MPKRIPLDWEDLERELHAAGVSPEEIDAGARVIGTHTCTLNCILTLVLIHGL